MIRVTPNWGSVVQPARYNSTRPDDFHQAQILIGSLDWNLFNSLWHRDMMCSPPDVRKGSLTPPAPHPRGCSCRNHGLTCHPVTKTCIIDSSGKICLFPRLLEMPSEATPPSLERKTLKGTTPKENHSITFRGKNVILSAMILERKKRKKDNSTKVNLPSLLGWRNVYCSFQYVDLTLRSCM